MWPCRDGAMSASNPHGPAAKALPGSDRRDADFLSPSQQRLKPHPGTFWSNRTPGRVALGTASQLCQELPRPILGQSHLPPHPTKPRRYVTAFGPHQHCITPRLAALPSQHVPCPSSQGSGAAFPAVCSAPHGSCCGCSPRHVFNSNQYFRMLESAARVISLQDHCAAK